MDGFLLDAYPESTPRGSVMVLWIKGRDGCARSIREPFTPAFYVHVRDGDAARARLAAMLPITFGGITGVAEETRRLGLEDEWHPVLRVGVRDHARLHRLASDVDRLGSHRAYDLYDVDIRAAHRHLLDRGLFPFARVRATGPGRIRLLDDSQWALHYEPPDLSTVRLRVTIASPQGHIPLPHHAIRSARLDDDILEGSERDVLEALAREIAQRDPDVILTDGGDRFLLPYLHHRARENGLPGFTLSREAGTTANAAPAPLDADKPREGRSYFTYGRVKYQPPKVLLQGRIHIDAESSFFHTQAGPAGLIDLARVTAIPLQELARLGAGTAITAIQIAHAKRQGRLVPWKKSRPEGMKTARALLLADRGGYTFDPVVGLHENVVELDFASLYPTLCVQRNLSPETVRCRCCAQVPTPGENGFALPTRFERVPQIGYNVCSRREGFIPQTLAPVLKRREHFKRMKREDPARERDHSECSDVYKWLLVTSFGYQGYRNAKFGAIECHESICAWSRDVLLDTAGLARDHGFEVLHGISDSLWLAPSTPTPAAQTHDAARVLSDAVREDTGIRFEYEGRYKWLVILPTRMHNNAFAHPEEATRSDGPVLGALNRYYGCFDAAPSKSGRSQASQPHDDLLGGTLKVRGVELRQRNTPDIVRQAQLAALHALAPAEDAAAFRLRIPRALDAAGRILHEVREGGVPLDALAVTTVVSRREEDYRVMNLTRAALVQMKAAGVTVPPGDAARYVVLDAQSPEADGMVRPVPLLSGEEAYDPEWYARLVLRSLESLFLPFGWTLPRLEDRFGAAPQRRLDHFLAWA